MSSSWILPPDLPASVALVWQEVTASAAIERRQKPVDAKAVDSVDFKAYVIVSSVPASPAGGVLFKNRPRQATGVVGSARRASSFVTGAMTTFGGVGAFNKISPSPSALPPREATTPAEADPSSDGSALRQQPVGGLSATLLTASPLADGTEVTVGGSFKISSPPSSGAFSPLPHQSAVSPTLSNKSDAGSAPPQHTTVDGHVQVYVHAPPEACLRTLSDVSGPHFVLGRTHRGAGSNKGPSASATDAAALLAADVFEPLVLDRQQGGHHEMYVLLYRKIGNDLGVAAELLHRLVFVEGGTGDGGGFALYFEAADKARLAPEAAAKVEERRRRVEKSFRVVSGKEFGCILMVSFTVSAV